mmetsp:Transcript_23509/g.54622  ORF Transcript_23509/g.54622 Transcript_23509/m.54622 type:complete len:112 (-) Transcript_23509:389-724(-)
MFFVYEKPTRGSWFDNGGSRFRLSLALQKTIFAVEINDDPLATHETKNFEMGWCWFHLQAKLLVCHCSAWGPKTWSKEDLANYGSPEECPFLCMAEMDAVLALTGKTTVSR